MIYKAYWLGHLTQELLSDVPLLLWGAMNEMNHHYTHTRKLSYIQDAVTEINHLIFLLKELNTQKKEDKQYGFNSNAWQRTIYIFLWVGKNLLEFLLN